MVHHFRVLALASDSTFALLAVPLKATTIVEVLQANRACMNYV